MLGIEECHGWLMAKLDSDLEPFFLVSLVVESDEGPIHPNICTEKSGAGVKFRFARVRNPRLNL